MQRRNSLATTGRLSGLDPAYLAAKKKLVGGKTLGWPLPKRQYGRTKEKLSIIGFGGMVVKDVTPKAAANHVAEAVDVVYGVKDRLEVEHGIPNVLSLLLGVLSQACQLQHWLLRSRTCAVFEAEEMLLDAPGRYRQFCIRR